MASKDLITGLHRPSALQFVLCYAIWIALSLFAFWVGWQFRTNLMDLLYVLRAHPFVVSAVDKFGLVILAIFALGYIIGLEHYFRVGLEKGKFWPRALKVAVIELVALVISTALQLAAISFAF